MTVLPSGTASPSLPANPDGRRDFDFIFGDWHVRNRKLTGMTDPSCDEWVEFDGSSSCQPVCDGWGNTDTFDVPNVPGGSPFNALTLRLYDPERALWQIWWTSSNRPGRLDPPVQGTFVDGRGVFEGHDELDGVPIEVRFTWSNTTAESPRWEQEFSFDEGDTWKRNWTMTMTRLAEPAL